MLHLYLDTADEHAIAELLPTGLFAGVTTNPVILERSGLGSADIPRVLEHALASGAKAVFLQSWGEGREELVARGRRLAALDPQVRVKVPATAEGLPAAAALVADGIEVLVTAVHTVAQALYAEAAGATTIAPYVGRIASSGGDGVGAHDLPQPDPRFGQALQRAGRLRGRMPGTQQHLRAGAPAVRLS